MSNALALRGLAANLVAGTRVALFVRVERTSFRFDAAQLLLVAIVSALVDALADWVRQPASASLDWSALGGEFAALAVLVAIAALASWLLRDPPLLVALPVTVLASLPLVQIANLVPWWLARHDASARAFGDVAYWLLLAWFIAVLVRSSYVALQPERRRVGSAIVVGALLAAPLVLPTGVLPEHPWFSASDGNSLESDVSNPASEAVLALQRELQDEALGNLADHPQSAARLYFIGFAPDGDGGTWRARLDKARSVMDTHWDTDSRSLVYVNDKSALTQAPMATITFLREALEEIATAGNADNDIVMLYVAGRNNADGSLKVSLPPLALVQLSGTGLAYLFKNAGVKWRIVVVDSCNSKSFVDALADANTLIIAAQGSPSCARSGAPTELGDTLFGEVLPTATSLPAAVAETHRRLAQRGIEPTVRMGEAIAGLLA
ncbi:MAG TPA: hypothetical protein VNG69_16870, partial [Casimicrobiaceae bacterium]|nr:hypothetical protein [Casimicrobiaceae bacterium]